MGGRLEVTIPRGDDVRWPNLFTAARDDRSALHSLMASEGSSPVGETVKIAITLPSAAITSTTLRSESDVQLSSEDATVVLVMNVDDARIGTDPVQWQVTW